MNLLWGFDLKKPLDEHGNVIEPNVSDYVQVGLNLFAPFLLLTCWVR